MNAGSVNMSICMSREMCVEPLEFSAFLGYIKCDITASKNVTSIDKLNVPKLTAPKQL